MVEIFFGAITRQAIRRGTFRSVRELTGAIGTFIDAYKRPLPPVLLDQGRRRITHQIRPSKDKQPLKILNRGGYRTV
jgi:hypothetical protein